jgi:signal transduction histidine kinase
VTRSVETNKADRAVSAAVDNSVSYYLRLSDRTGKPITIAGLPLEQLQMTSGAEQWNKLRTRSGVWYRQISLPFYAQNHLWGYLQVGRSMTDLNKNLTALRLALLLGCPIAVVLIGCSSWWLTELAMQPVYQSYQQMRQFTAHELRTPLAAMQSTIESAFLQQEQQDNVTVSESENLSILTILKRQNTRISQLVKDLLLLARIDQQNLPGQHSSCSLNDLIDDLIEEMASLALAAKVTLSARIQGEEQIYVWGNEEQLYRVFCNLIDNAIKATPEAGKVTVVLGRFEKYAVIQVRDTGIGMSPDD